MNSIRIRFTRGENVKFISHLDLMKVFERAARRSGLPIAYSQGFNPHPNMVFGLPLSVGVTSEGEYADFELSQPVPPQQFMDVLNASLPEAVRVTAAGEKKSRENIMASISGADYSLEIFSEKPVSFEEAAAKLRDLMGMESVKVMKEGKGAAKEIDIRPLILGAEMEVLEQKPSGYEEFPSAFRIHARFAAGNTANLRPELFVKALAEKTGFPATVARFHRKALYVASGGNLTDPLDPAVTGKV